MKYTLLIIAITTLFLTANANASLIDRGNGLIYDADLDITWLKDANYAMTSGFDVDGLMTWQEAMDWADQLEYLGFSNWRLPVTAQPDESCSDSSYNTYGELNYYGFNCTGSEMGHLFYEELGGSANVSIYDLLNSSSDTDLLLFDNLISSYYWSSTTYQDASHPRDAWRFGLVDGSIARSPQSQATGHRAWAVHDGDIGAVSTIPLPASIWLLGSGLVVLTGLSRR